MSTELQERVTRNVRILMAVQAINDQKTLAARLNWGADKLTRTLRGERRWAVADLQELADVFGLTPGDMLSDAHTLVASSVPARTGTDHTYGSRVTARVTSEYVPGNNADVIQFPQVREPRTGYYSKRTIKARRPSRPQTRQTGRHPFAEAAV